jgi:hypothetical protein
MNGVGLLDRVAQLLYLAEPLLGLFFVVFVWKTSPGEILRLYPSRVRMSSVLPFGTSWQKEMTVEHAAVIKRFRRRAFAFLSVVLAVPLLGATYYWFLFMRLRTLSP